MSYLDILKAQLSTDEGYRTRSYRDSVGKLTAGVGRNLEDVPFTAGEISLMLDNDMARADAAAHRLVPNFDDLTDARKAVVANICFQLGEKGFGAFKDTLQAIQEGRWDDAADALLDSKVAREQAPARWARHAQAMREG